MEENGCMESQRLPLTRSHEQKKKISGWGMRLLWDAGASAPREAESVDLCTTLSSESKCSESLS